MSDYEDLTRSEGEPTSRADVVIQFGAKVVGFEATFRYSGVDQSSFTKALVAVCALLSSLIPAGVGGYVAYALGTPHVGVMIAGGVLYIGCLLVIGAMVLPRKKYGRKRQA